MSFHYGQRVEVYTGETWLPGTVDTEGSHGQLRVLLDDGGGVWADRFYIRSLLPGDEVAWDITPARERDPKGDS